MSIGQNGMKSVRDVHDDADPAGLVTYLVKRVVTLNQLIGQMYMVLQHTCEEADECCILWPDHTKQCMLRDIEDEMEKLGFDSRWRDAWIGAYMKGKDDGD